MDSSVQPVVPPVPQQSAPSQAPQPLPPMPPPPVETPPPSPMPPPVSTPASSGSGSKMIVIALVIVGICIVASLGVYILMMQKPTKNTVTRTVPTSIPVAEPTTTATAAAQAGEALAPVNSGDPQIDKDFETIDKSINGISSDDSSVGEGLKAEKPSLE